MQVLQVGASTYRLVIICLFILLYFSSVAIAQKERNCGSVLDPGSDQSVKLESWIRKKIKERELISFQTLKTKETVYKIPVVVHIIHNGEPIGIGSNISDSQVLSQIEVLNEDYRRLNSDTTLTRALWAGVAADIEIEFVMAKQDPEGNATDGIVRVQGAKTSWTQSDDVQLKNTSIWPVSDYLNMWVTTLAGNLLGYSSFPDPGDTGLPGLDDSDITVDGVVMGFQYFGSIDKDPSANLDNPFDLGRTTTHEVGHYFGLRHLWGDNLICEQDDFVPDTPEQRNPSNGSYNELLDKATCESTDMFENYMDYTDDAGMSLFTENQKERMRLIVEGSPDRITLLTSPGLNDPTPNDLDAGIAEIIEPQSEWCLPDMNPSIWVKNFGMDTIQSIQVSYAIDASTIETQTRFITLPSLDSTLITFAPIQREDKGFYNFQFEILQVNDTIDDNPQNNLAQTTTEVLPFLSLPYLDPLDSIPADWERINSGEQLAFEFLNVNNLSSSNQALSLKLYEEETTSVESIATPNIDISGLSSPYLFFDVAYGYRGLEDRLQILYSSNCGANFDNILRDFTGSEINTSPYADLNFEFFPSDRSDWKRVFINLENLESLPNFRLAFTAVNAGGNNIFIDNIGIVDQDYQELIISELAAPTSAICNTVFTPAITFENAGISNINSFQFTYNLGSQSGSIDVSALNLSMGSFIDVGLPELNIQSGTNTLDINLQTVNERTINTTNNFQISNNCNTEVLPYRERFNNGLDTWSIESVQSPSWQTTTTNFGESAYVPCFNNTLLGTKHLLTSQVLDLTNNREASLFFDLSYASNPESSSDILNIYVSENNSSQTENLVYSKPLDSLAVAESTIEWLPSTDGNWLPEREFIDLSTYAGREIRISFEAVCASGNNVYLDNLEFFISNNSMPVIPQNNLVQYPNPAVNKQFNLAFNLEEKENVEITIVDHMGRNVDQKTFNNTLNQTYPFDLAGKGSGMYFLVIKGQSFSDVVKVVLYP